jgi:hypothetical protein
MDRTRIPSRKTELKRKGKEKEGLSINKGHHEEGKSWKKVKGKVVPCT